jgi:hypothetical protein
LDPKGAPYSKSLSLAKCEAACASDPGCTAVVVPVLELVMAGHKVIQTPPKFSIALYVEIGESLVQYARRRLHDPTARG